MLAVTLTNAQAYESCIPVGGSAIANVFNNGKSIVAVLSGSFSTARGEITESRKTETGMAMKMEHWFMNETGGSFQTKDEAVLTAVKGRDSQFIVNIQYHVQENTAAGCFEGYRGKFQSHGLIDLDREQVVVRYSGEICS